jgi:hypothetical protein
MKACPAIGAGLLTPAKPLTQSLPSSKVRGAWEAFGRSLGALQETRAEWVFTQLPARSARFLIPGLQSVIPNLQSPVPSL